MMSGDGGVVVRRSLFLQSSGVEKWNLARKVLWVIWLALRSQ